MKVMVMVMATPEIEAAGEPPSPEAMEAMGKFNEELIKAGVMLAAEGLKPSSAGARVRLDGASRTVTDGPFTETKELIAGFWLWQVRSLEEAIEWAKKMPNPMPGASNVHIRPLFELEDMAEWDQNGEFAAGVKARRAQLAAKG
jgi:PhnB protein